MTTKITYISSDGEEFETEEECLEYEKSMDPDGAVILFDGEMHPMVDGDVTDRYERAMYIFIRNAEKAETFFNWIHSYAGFEVPQEFADMDMFYYNETDDRYDDFLQKLKEMEEQRDILIKRIEEVSE